MKILSFGSLNIDYCYTLDHNILPGETLASSSLTVNCGGKGLNQSVALSKAGAEVWHAGMIGYDGEMLRQMLEEAGVNTSLLKTNPEHRSGHTIIQIEEKTGQNSIIVTAGTNKMISKEFIDDVLEGFEAGDAAVFQNETSNIAYAMKGCQEKGIRVVFNPSPMDDELITSDIYQYVDDLFINEIEGAQLSGETDPEKILKVMKEKWPNCRVILTLGADGAAILAEDGSIIHQAAFPCEAVDTTAAGDTFSGYFETLISQGKSPQEALKISCKASSLAVQKQGAAASIPTMEEVLAAM